MTELPVELAGSPTWTEQIGNSQGRREWLVDVEDVLTFTGRPVKGVTAISAGTPWAGTELDQLICDSISVKQVGAGYTTGGITYPCVAMIVTASYRTLQGLETSGLISYQGDVRLIGVPPDSVTDTPAQIRVPAGVISISQYYPFLASRIKDLNEKTCKINNASWRGFATGTVLFESFSLTPIASDSLGLLDKVDYKFRHNPQGWNSIPDGFGGWITRSPALYSAVNFGDLNLG